MKFATTILFLAVSLVAGAQRGDPQKINAPYRNKPNPFLHVLGLDPFRISLSRDSTRIALDDGGYVEMILDRKRLWRFQQFAPDGRALDSGDLSGGTGRVHFVNGRHAVDAQFERGVLQGDVMRSEMRSGLWVVMLRARFRNGLLQGEVRHQSILYPQYISIVEHYNNGIIWMSESYGRRNWLWGWLWFLVDPLKDTGKVCSRTFYVDGVMQLHSCPLVRNCRTCGI